MMNAEFVDLASELQAQVIQLEAYPSAQQLLESFFRTASSASEPVRIQLAKQMYQDWQTASLSPHLLPAVPERDDWWYLIQLFALNRHCDNFGKPWHFDLSQAGEIVVMSPCVPPDLHTASPIWQALLHESDMSGGRAIYGDQTTLTRAKIDQLLQQYAALVLTKYNLDPALYELRHINFAELVRVSTSLKIVQDDTYIHLDGYRVRFDGQTNGLIAGNSAFGGARFIDSWWSDIFHNKVAVCLVISKKYEL